MKKIVVLSLAIIVLIGTSVGCTKPETEGEGLTLKVGATPVPHVEILEFVKPILEEKGITLQIVEFTDYVQPNLSLADGELDANFSSISLTRGVCEGPRARPYLQRKGSY